MKVEISTIDGGRAAKIVTLFILIPSVLSIPIAIIALACGVRIPTVDTWTDLAIRYLQGLLGLGGLYLTVRLNCWIYNKIAGRFGGFQYWTK